MRGKLQVHRSDRAFHEGAEQRDAVEHKGILIKRFVGITRPVAAQEAPEDLGVEIVADRGGGEQVAVTRDVVGADALPQIVDGEQAQRTAEHVVEVVLVGNAVSPVVGGCEAVAPVRFLPAHRQLSTEERELRVAVVEAEPLGKHVVFDLPPLGHAATIFLLAVVAGPVLVVEPQAYVHLYVTAEVEGRGDPHALVEPLPVTFIRVELGHILAEREAGCLIGTAPVGVYRHGTHR